MRKRLEHDCDIAASKSGAMDEKLWEAQEEFHDLREKTEKRLMAKLDEGHDPVDVQFGAIYLGQDVERAKGYMNSVARKTRRAFDEWQELETKLDKSFRASRSETRSRKSGPFGVWVELDTTTHYGLGAGHLTAELTSVFSDGESGKTAWKIDNIRYTQFRAAPLGTIELDTNGKVVSAVPLNASDHSPDSLTYAAGPILSVARGRLKKLGREVQHGKPIDMRQQSRRGRSAGRSGEFEVTP